MASQLQNARASRFKHFSTALAGLLVLVPLLGVLA
eukprot:COSAG02_NODE_59833_length_273_cov_0.591954_1_plen_34_part_01